MGEGMNICEDCASCPDATSALCERRIDLIPASEPSNAERTNNTFSAWRDAGMPVPPMLTDVEFAELAVKARGSHTPKPNVPCRVKVYYRGRMNRRGFKILKMLMRRVGQESHFGLKARLEAERKSIISCPRACPWPLSVTGECG